jgi:hypothetical protein
MVREGGPSTSLHPSLDRNSWILRPSDENPPARTEEDDENILEEKEKE